MKTSSIARPELWAKLTMPGIMVAFWTLKSSLMHATAFQAASASMRLSEGHNMNHCNLLNPRPQLCRRPLLLSSGSAINMRHFALGVCYAGDPAQLLRDARKRSRRFVHYTLDSDRIVKEEILALCRRSGTKTVTGCDFGRTFVALASLDVLSLGRFRLRKLLLRHPQSFDVLSSGSQFSFKIRGGAGTMSGKLHVLADQIVPSADTMKRGHNLMDKFVKIISQHCPTTITSVHKGGSTGIHIYDKQ